MVTRSSHSISMCPPHSPTRITKKSILKLAGAFHWPKTSRIRFWAFSYSRGEPCGRSNQLMTYFMAILREVESRWAPCPLDGLTKTPSPDPYLFSRLAAFRGRAVQHGRSQWPDPAQVNLRLHGASLHVLLPGRNR